MLPNGADELRSVEETADLTERIGDIGHLAFPLTSSVDNDELDRPITAPMPPPVLSAGPGTAAPVLLRKP